MGISSSEANRTNADYTQNSTFASFYSFRLRLCRWKFQRSNKFDELMDGNKDIYSCKLLQKVSGFLKLLEVFFKPLVLKYVVKI